MVTIKLRDIREIDKRILFNLVEDSQQPFSEIAEKVGTTRQNISQKVKKFKEINLIKSFTINLNNEIIEELKVKAYILFREDPNTKIRKENENMIIKIPQIIKFCRLFGKYDGIIEILAKDNEEIAEIMSKLHSLEGIKETETFIMHTIIKNDEKAPILNLLE
ncbi:MAG: Lrp/AsnC family transcriptional regulator [Promethearchaeota archaeon]